MPRLNRNDNFIDKTFTIVADLILKVFPTSRLVKEAFIYIINGKTGLEHVSFYDEGVAVSF